MGAEACGFWRWSQSEVTVVARRGAVCESCHWCAPRCSGGKVRPTPRPPPLACLGGRHLMAAGRNADGIAKRGVPFPYISPPSTPAVCHAPSTPSPFGPHQLMRPAGPVPPTSVVSRLQGGHQLITSCTTFAFELL